MATSTNDVSPLRCPNRNRGLPSARRRRSRLHDFAPSRSTQPLTRGWGDSFVALGPAEAGKR
jgi:hypothetical protein